MNKKKETEFVSIPLDKYESMAIICERFFVLREFVKKSDYVTSKDLRIILGLEKEGEE